MRFIPILKICDLLEFSKDLSSHECMEELIQLIIERKDQPLVYNGKPITSSEIDAIVKAMQQQNYLIFQSWIQQNKPLASFLSSEIPSKPFADSHKLLNHTLSGEYKDFLSPVLAPLILQYENSKNHLILSNAFSFVVLLNRDYRTVTESKICSAVIDHLTELVKKGAALNKEQELVEVVTPLCSDEVIEVMNHLSRASYALKINYVDQVLEVIHLNACTVRLANWLLKQIQKLQLNEEHSTEVKQVHKNLAEGRIQVKNTTKRRAVGITYRQFFTWFLILFLGFSTFYVLTYQSKDEEEQISQDTSFGQFTKEERQKIDSLLRTIQKNKDENGNLQDQGMPVIGESEVIISRTPFHNQKMEKLLLDYKKDANLQENGNMDSCAVFDAKKQKAQRYKGVKDLLLRKGKQQVMVKNDSEYDAVFIVFEDKVGGAVYSTFLTKNQLSSFKINVGDQIICIPGNELGKFIAPNVEQDDLPSKDFDHHFCSVDENYQYGILTTYQFITQQTGTVKFMITGMKGSYYQLLDINGVLVTK